MATELPRDIGGFIKDLRSKAGVSLRQLAEQLKNNPQQLARPLDPNTKMLSQQDLKSMLDRLERMSRSGDKEAAKQFARQGLAIELGVKISKVVTGEAVTIDYSNAEGAAKSATFDKLIVAIGRVPHTAGLDGAAVGLAGGAAAGDLLTVSRDQQ